MILGGVIWGGAKRIVGLLSDGQKISIRGGRIV